MSDIKQSQSPPPSMYAGVTGGAAAAVAGAHAGLGPNTVVLSKQLKPNVGAPGVVAEKVLAPQIDIVQPKKTKIVATLGPASSSVDVLSKLIASGVDVFRLNMSHGTQEMHAQTAKNIREAVKVAGRAVGIMADLQGPKFRTGLIDSPTKKVLVKKGDSVDVITSDLRPGFLGTAQCVASGTAHADVMVREVEVGHRILINDGAVVLRVVKRVSKQQVTCVVLVGGDVGEKKGMNVPELKVPIPAITEKDAKDAVFALSLEVDFMALSFVQRPEDITQLKELLEADIKADPKNPSRVPRIPKIVAKIEKPQAIDDIDNILAVVDVIMVARGDLGVECSLESVPVYQKLLIEKANKALVPVITATQMLESMITNASPTRAEVSDVANAVFDGTDAVMLSGESAMGAYPVEAVQMMACIVETAERSIRQKALQPAIAAAAAATAASGAAASGVATGSGGLGGVGVASPIHRAVSGRDAVHHPHMQMHLSFPSAEFMHHAMALSAHVAAQGLQARAIVAICLTYDMACYVSKLRSLCPVVAVTPSARLFRVFQLNYGLVPVHMPSQNAKDKNITSSDAYIVEMERTLKAALPHGVLAPGELYIFVSGTSPVPGLTHSMQALRFGEAAKQMHAVAAPAAAAAAAPAAK